MSDRDFDLRLQRVLRADAERAVRPFDPVAFAEAAVATTPTTRRLEWRPAGWPMIRLLLIASLLLLVAVATLWLVTGAPKRGIVQVPPSTSPSGVALIDDLLGGWIAPNPGNVVVAGEAITDPLVFEVGSGGAEAYFPIGSGRERVPSAISEPSTGVLKLVTRPGVVDDLSLAGTSYRVCTSGEEGTYRPHRSADSLLLTFDLVADTCPSRQAMLARTWTRSLGRPSSGGIGVVDAFDPVSPSRCHRAATRRTAFRAVSRSDRRSRSSSSSPGRIPRASTTHATPSARAADHRERRRLRRLLPPAAGLHGGR